VAGHCGRQLLQLVGQLVDAVLRDPEREQRATQPIAVAGARAAGAHESADAGDLPEQPAARDGVVDGAFAVVGALGERLIQTQRAVVDAGWQPEDPAQPDRRGQHCRSTLAAREIDPLCESRFLFPIEQSRARCLSQVEPDRIQRLDPLRPGRRLR
jgi:hypothetical protein